jgi:hypothetical protein
MTFERLSKPMHLKIFAMRKSLIKTALGTPDPVYNPKDDLRHHPELGNGMRDSLFQEMIMSDEQIRFQTYLYPNCAGKAGFNVVLWGAADRRRYHSRRVVNDWIWIAKGEWEFGGYAVRDGELLPISHMKHNAQYGTDMTPRQLKAELIDIHGGSVLLSLKRFGIVKLPINDKMGPSSSRLPTPRRLMVSTDWPVRDPLVDATQLT